jgi:hypothetical protein
MLADAAPRSFAIDLTDFASASFFIIQKHVANYRDAARCCKIYIPDIGWNAFPNAEIRQRQSNRRTIAQSWLSGFLYPESSRNSAHLTAAHIGG